MPSADVVLVPSGTGGTITRCFWPEELEALLVGAGLEVDWVRPRTVLTPAAVERALEQGGRDALHTLATHRAGAGREPHRRVARAAPAGQRPPPGLSGRRDLAQAADASCLRWSSRQRADSGRNSSRASSIGWPQSTQAPYVPASIRARAASMSARWPEAASSSASSRSLSLISVPDVARVLGDVAELAGLAGALAAQGGGRAVELAEELFQGRAGCLRVHARGSSSSSCRLVRPRSPYPPDLPAHLAWRPWRPPRPAAPPQPALLAAALLLGGPLAASAAAAAAAAADARGGPAERRRPAAGGRGAPRPRPGVPRARAGRQRRARPGAGSAATALPRTVQVEQRVVLRAPATSRCASGARPRRREPVGRVGAGDQVRRGRLAGLHHRRPAARAGGAAHPGPAARAAPAADDRADELAARGRLARAAAARRARPGCRHRARGGGQPDGAAGGPAHRAGRCARCRRPCPRRRGGGRRGHRARCGCRRRGPGCPRRSTCGARACGRAARRCRCASPGSCLVSGTTATVSGGGTSPVPGGAAVHGTLQDAPARFEVAVDGPGELALDLTAVPALDPRTLVPPDGAPPGATGRPAGRTPTPAAPRSTCSSRSPPPARGRRRSRRTSAPTCRAPAAPASRTPSRRSSRSRRCGRRWSRGRGALALSGVAGLLVLGGAVGVWRQS